MKLKLNFEELEDQWKNRQIDLFPWLQGLYALLRSREANIRETGKRLSSSSPATMVQFLSSFDPENIKLAEQIIKEQDPAIILPPLLYSLEKIEKSGYSDQVIKSLLNFKPAFSFGYLLGYLNERKLSDLEKIFCSNQQEYFDFNAGQKHKSKIFHLINTIFTHINQFFPSLEEQEGFLDQIFQALSIDLKERMPLYGTVATRKDFISVRVDLEVILNIFKVSMYEENGKIVEEKIQRLGREIIISLHKLPFDSEKGNILFKHLIETIHYMAILRLKADKPFLQSLSKKIDSFDLHEVQRNEIIQSSGVAINIIDRPEDTITKILDELEVPFFT